MFLNNSLSYIKYQYTYLDSLIYYNDYLVTVDNYMNIETLDKVTSIISHFTIIFAMTSLMVQIKQNWLLNRIMSKDRFIACTAKYIKIQELLLLNDNFTYLNFNIYKNRHGIMNNDSNAHSIAKDLALAGMMFQLMEDVWLMHDLDKNRSKELYSGWENLFEDWMNVKEIAEKWPILRFHFSKNFIQYIEGRYSKQIADILPLDKESEEQPAVGWEK